VSESGAMGPGIMPIDREAWGKKINLCNFINAYYQMRDVGEFAAVKRILLIGPGQGLDTVVLRWRGYEVTTFDIDTTFKPNVVGSVHDMDMFKDSDFDVAIASHVLEHLPLSYLDKALAEIARVARHAIIYLPVHGRTIQMRLAPGLLGWDWSWIIDICYWWRKPNDEKARFMSGQHFWEIGLWSCSLKAIRERMENFFEIKRVYRNHDWRPSMNFLLSSRQHSPSVTK